MAFNGQWQAPAGQCPAWDPSGRPCVLGYGHPAEHMTADGLERWRRGTAPNRAANWPRSILKLVLVVWTLAYPVVSCSPFLIGPANDVETAAAGGTSLVLSAVIFFPWIIGIIILGVVVAVTRD